MLFNGHVAEWLRNGLQNRVPRFNSGRGLQPSLLRSFGSASLFCEGCRAEAPAKAGHSFSTLSKASLLCYIGADTSRLFPGSSVVEQPAVNRLVAGSNPARGATYRLCTA